MITTPLVLVVLLGLLGGGLWWGFKTMTAEVPAEPGKPCVTQPMTELATSSVTVNVFNGGDQRGLAAKIAKNLREGGFNVKTVANTETRVRATTIIGAAADSPEVQLVASWFVTPEIQADDRVDHTVDILVGNEYGGQATTPPTSLTIPSGQVCLPDTSSPTPTPSGQPT